MYLLALPVSIDRITVICVSVIDEGTRPIKTLVRSGFLLAHQFHHYIQPPVVVKILPRKSCPSPEES